MLLSSCVVWRHLDWDDFRAECPGGDEALQRLIWERLDDALDWLVSLGAEPVWQDTENPRTTGKRFDPRALTELLARDVELETPLPAEPTPPLVLATGGFAKRLADERGLLLRANPWSDGAGLDYATARGAELTGGHGRVLRPRDAGAAGADPRGGLRAALAALRPLGARLHRRRARHHAGVGVVVTRTTSRSGSARARGTCSTTRARARAERVEAARAAGGTVVDPAELPFDTPPGSASPCTSPPPSRTRSAASDRHARACRAASTASHAAGVDAGGVATGGYASGLAQALVLGLVAAEELSRLRYAQARLSPGSGDGATFATRSVLPSCSTSAPTAGGSPSRSRSS